MEGFITLLICICCLFTYICVLDNKLKELEKQAEEIRKIKQVLKGYRDKETL